MMAFFIAAKVGAHFRFEILDRRILWAGLSGWE